ncbi:unnamed protein product [Cyclocybe aegerita]|uniref:Uncharacterized protein n=1 Tax=Cyclocybe aegerita TaxID=1973307 RepID=A0A8S0VR90_CYCAE|nr:unnamed protein product [Cyclocybe aegerita]
MNCSELMFSLSLHFFDVNDDAAMIAANDMSNTNITEELRTGPHHHVHRENEPLPGATGGAPTFDYSPETIDHATLPPAPAEGVHPPQHGTHKPVPTPHFAASNERPPVGVDRGQAVLLPGAEGAHKNEKGLPNPPRDGNRQDIPTQSLVGPGGISGNERQGKHSTSTPHQTSHQAGHGAQHKPTVGDKIVGKTEELAGKLAQNPGLQEKGALRAQGERT